MTITAFFETLGAPLVNSRWSWGAVRASDGVVFLRAWEDQVRTFDTQPHMLIDHHAGLPIKGRNPGHRERRIHIAAVRRGAPCYLVVCKARDVEAKPRSITGFDRETLLLAGRVLDHDGQTWAEVVRSVPLASVRSVTTWTERDSVDQFGGT